MKSAILLAGLLTLVSSAPAGAQEHTAEWIRQQRSIWRASPEARSLDLGRQESVESRGLVEVVLHLRSHGFGGAKVPGEIAMRTGTSRTVLGFDRDGLAFAVIPSDASIDFEWKEEGRTRDLGKVRIGAAQATPAQVEIAISRAESGQVAAYAGLLGGARQQSAGDLFAFAQALEEVPGHIPAGVGPEQLRASLPVARNRRTSVAATHTESAASARGETSRAAGEVRVSDVEARLFALGGLDPASNDPEVRRAFRITAAARSAEQFLAAHEAVRDVHRRLGDEENERRSEERAAYWRARLAGD
jgi:hypothetical protein